MLLVPPERTPQEHPRQPPILPKPSLSASSSLPGLDKKRTKQIVPVLGVRSSKITHPTGDPNFAVLQAFPSGFSAEEADPFLMCDEFGPMSSPSGPSGPDEFPVDWHPHRGMDLLTYMVEGVCRHADSMGNRECFPAPAMQWISAGSGIEHAEGGGSPKGQMNHGFQIWVNVPSNRKMDDPSYGTHPEKQIPVYVNPQEAPGVRVRVLAGPFESGHFKARGPFKTIVEVQMLDVVLEAGASFEHTLPCTYDNCLIYAYGKKGIMSKISGTLIKPGQIARMDLSAATDGARNILMEAASEGLRVLIFAGKMLKQPIAWHGPFVMTTQEEIKQTVAEYQRGTFLRKRVKWDYKKIATAPPGTFK